ncbi:MAG: sulfatase [Clostridia bacterium]|nr:sulfatase [Clostridia bacterium]
MKQHPNLLFVIADQFRRYSMGFWSDPTFRPHLTTEPDPVHTPHFDAFARQSVVLSRAISNYPVCSPFRAMLFSGQFPEENGVWHNCAPHRDYELRGDIPTFPSVLHDCGYHTGYIGKWHLECPRPDFDPEGNYIADNPNYDGPRRFPDGSMPDNINCWNTLIPKGRQRNIDFLHAYNTWDVFRGNAEMNPLRKPVYWDNDCRRYSSPDGQWSPEYETDLAISYLENKDGMRPQDDPFALFVCYNPPHLPYESREDTDYDMYDNYYSEQAQPDVQKLIARDNVTLEGEEYERHARVHFSHVSGIDRQFGRLLETLDQQQLAEDTIVIFCSDHGEMMGSHGLMSKNVLYEEAMAIPFLIRCPGLTPKVDDLLLSGVDIMPTTLSLMGLADHIPSGLQGTDYAAAFSSDVPRPQSALFVQMDTKGLQTEHYTFSISDGGAVFTKPALYDNFADPYQMHNLSFDAIPPEDLLFLRKQLGYWLKQSNDPWWQQRKYADFIVYPD